MFKLFRPGQGFPGVAKACQGDTGGPGVSEPSTASGGRGSRWSSGPWALFLEFKDSSLGEECS